MITVCYGKNKTCWFCEKNNLVVAYYKVHRSMMYGYADTIGICSDCDVLVFRRGQGGTSEDMTTAVILSEVMDS